MVSLWTKLHAHFHQTLRKKQLLPPKMRFLVAVSGGQDSLCLIKLLLDLQSKWDWQIAIAHCDHRWRTDSSANADHIAQLAQTWQLPYHQKTATSDLPNEATARNWRYQALTEIALEFDYPAILTGHTLSDRAETVLYNLIRGSGADGLQSLTWKRLLAPDILLIRPLLGVTRSQTAAFCQTFNLPIWEDTTNQNPKYTRNRLRLELIPTLAQQFNPQIEQHLAQTAELLQADVDYLEQQAASVRQQGQHPTDPQINRSILQTAPLALQRRAIRQFLQGYLPHAPNFEQIEKTVTLISAPNQACSDPFPGGAIATVKHPWIVLTFPTP